ncbi:MAG: PAS domain S-box protein [Gemmatimonadota bacterium]
MSLIMGAVFLSLILLYVALLAGAWSGRRRRERLARGDYAAGASREAMSDRRDRSVVDRRELDTLQRELLEGLNLLSGVIESSPNPIFVKDLGGRYQILNRATASLTGRQVHEMLGQTPDAIFPAGTAKRVSEVDRRVIETGESVEIEETLQTADGERTFLSLKTPYRGPDNVMRGLIGLAWDITAQQREEAARARHAAILDLTSDFVVTIDPGGQVSYLNPAAREALALGPDEAAPSSLSEYFTESAAAVLLREAIPAVLSTGRWTGESAWRSRTGHVIPVSQIILAHYGPAGRVEFLSIVARDITVSKAAERAVRQSEERFRTLSAGAPIGIFFTDATGLRTYHNSRWVQISGLSLEASLGIGWVNAVHPEDRKQTVASWQRNVVEGQEWNQEHRILTPGGTVRWVHAMASPIRDASRITGFVGTIEDITSRREIDERLRESNQRLRALAAHSQQELEDEQSRISREIHDQLGQSLTALKMDTGWLSRRMGSSMGDESERLRQMGELIDTTVQTVRRISARLRPVVLDTLGLTAAIEWALEEFEKRTGLRSELRDDAPDLKLAGDPSIAIFRILQEGLTNVARHAGASSVLVSLECVDSQFVMTVDDDGRGLPEGQSQDTTLGILGMQERAALVQGSIEVVSLPGRGTRLRVWVPLA